MALDACSAAKAEGNTAYAAGDLDLAVKQYTLALDHWDEALDNTPKPKTFSVGECVVYNSKGFGRVESAFSVMDEYFLTDLGTDMPIWVGDAGGDLRRFWRSDLQPVPKELFDLRLACTQNLAAVKLKQEDFKMATKWADEALRMDGKALKALMRKGSALLKDGQAGPASDVLLAAQSMSPKDAEVKKLLWEAEKRRGPTWVCASGCCGPWGLGNHILAPPTNLNTLGKLGAPKKLGPMTFGPTTAGKTIAADDDSDSECSTCSSKDNQDGLRKEPSKKDEEVNAAAVASSSSAALNDELSSSKPAEEHSRDGHVASLTPAAVQEIPAQAGEPADSASEQRGSQELRIGQELGRKVETSKHFSTIAAALFAALAAVLVAWQLGNVGAMATATGVN